MEGFPRRITRGMALRMGADAVMLQLALAAALAVTFARRLVNFENELPPPDLLLNYIEYWAQSGWLIALVTLTVFYLMGIYTYGRFYQGRYRALTVLQGVAQSYLIFAVAVHLFSGRSLMPNLGMPRGTIVLAGVFSAILIVGSRIWSELWDKIVHVERSRMMQPKKVAGRTVLVIGGAGYIGSALLPKLLEKGYRVRLLDLMVFGEEPIAQVAHHPNLEVVYGDFRHVECVVEAMRGVDAVIHLGAIVGDPACSLDEDLTIDVNLSATRMIGELAKAAGIERFIFASTCSVYGACDETLDERSMVRPISLYGQTKLASERILRRMADDRFKPTIVRFATIYGLSGRTRFDLVVNLLTAKAKIDGKITISGGSQWRPFVHVDDAAEAVARILDASQDIVGNQIFNVGSNDQNYTILQIGEMVHEQVISAELLVNEEDTDRRNYRVDFSQLRNLVGFEPKWTVERGIRQVLEAIANGEVEDYAEARYSNVKFLTESAAASQVRRNWAKNLIESIQLE